VITPAYSPTATERVLPSMALDFTTGALDPRITFTRSTTATFVGSNGFIQSAAINAPRFDYDPVTLAAKGLLIEEQRANVVTYSEQLDNVAWNKTAVTVTANATTSPDGTVNADAIYQTAVTSLQAVNSAAFVATIGVTYTLSVYLKAGTSRFVQVTFPSTAMGATQYANIDLTDVTVTASAASTVSVASVGNGWVRVNYTVAATNLSNLSPFIIAINSGTAARGAIITGNVANFFYVYGVQVEAGAFATSYIPTVASQVTRSADVASMTGTNFSSWYNPTQGTIVSSASTLKPPSVSASNSVVFASDGTANERIQIVYDAGNITIAVFDGPFMAGFTAAYTLNQIVNSAIAYKVNDFAASFNGGTATTDTSGTIPTVNRLSIGSGWDGTNFFLTGHVRSIRYYPLRLTNAELQAFTK